MGLTLREGNREYFYHKLDENFVGLKEKYIKTYGNSYEIVSPNNKNLMTKFHNICRENNIVSDIKEIFSYMHKYENKKFQQLKFF